MSVRAPTHPIDYGLLVFGEVAYTLTIMAIAYLWYHRNWAPVRVKNLQAMSMCAGSGVIWFNSWLVRWRWVW